MSRRAILACSTAILRSQQLKFVVFNHLHEPLVRSVSSSCGVFNEVYSHSSVHGALHKRGNVILEERSWIHSTCRRNMTQEAMKPVNIPESGGASSDSGNDKVKRKKLKGKRAVRRWLRFFRWKKKKEYERMTAEEKILYKLRKARNKETRLLEAMKKIEPKETSETTHDPEILTPEEHFYFLKMGLKCKNYVPVGRRGIYQGVILNMHLHWKKHQTLQVIVKTFTPDEVKEVAVELARLSGGIVLDIHEENTIIMYRGKNYSQPPTEIMSPRVTLPRIKALNKSKYRDGLRAVRKFIPRLEQDLDLLQAQVKSKHEAKMEVINGSQETEISSDREAAANQRQESSDRLQKLLAANNELYEQNSATESGMTSESEGLSDIFETDSDEEVKDGKRTEHSLYLDELEKFPTESNGEAEDFEEHLRQISSDPKTKNDEELPDLDEVDRIVLRAGSLLLRKKSGDRR